MGYPMGSPALRPEGQLRTWNHICHTGVVYHVCFSLAYLFRGTTLGAAQAGPQEQIKIEVNKGGNSTHRTNSRYDSPIIVAVTDSADRPIPGADVDFTAPPDGASAIFPNGGRTAQLQTDAAGLVRIWGLRANSSPGQYEIRVRVSFGGEAARAAISQLNERPPLVTKKRVALVVASSAAAVISVLALRPAPTPTATISVVTPTGPVGPP